MALCSDLHLLVRGYLSHCDVAYINYGWCSHTYAAQNDLVDGLLNREPDASALLDDAGTLRMARFFVNGMRVAPRELGNVQSTEVLSFLLAKGFWYGEDLLSALAHNGRLDTLRFAISHSPGVDTHSILNSALRGGSLECAVFAHEELGVAFDSDSMCEAATVGDLQLVRYAHEHGCPPCPRALCITIFAGNLACTEYIHETVGMQWTQFTPRCALIGNNIDVLRYVVETGAVMPADACDEAARSGSLDVVKYLHSLGCALTAQTCAAAAVSDFNISILEWLHNNGCPWDTETCATAAAYGAVLCLRYAHTHGCKWDERTILRSIRNGQTQALRYAHENGCPWPQGVPLDIFDDEVFKYVVDHHPGWNATSLLNYTRREDFTRVEYMAARHRPTDLLVAAAAAARGHRFFMLFPRISFWTALAALGTGNLESFAYITKQMVLRLFVWQK